MFKQVFFICILLLTPVHSRRSSGGGSFSSSRGSSGARAGVAPGGFNPQSNQGFHPQPNSGFHPQPNPGFQPNQGGFRPQPNQGFNGQHPGGFNQGPHMPAGGFNNNRGFGGGTSHFVPGNGMGSAKSGSSFKSALAGAALGTIGGLAAFELGKAIISSASTPIHHNNKDYYWGQEYHQQKPGEIRCAMPLNDLIQNVPVETTTAASGATTVATDVTTTPTPNQLLSQLQFANGTRPKEIVWSCKQGTEVCCGTDCCAAPVQQNNNMNNPNGASSQGGSGSSIFGIILGVLLVIALLACCCCFAVYKLCRSSLDSCLPSSNRHEEHYYEDGQKYEGPSYGNSYPLQPTQYSNQPYSNQPYPHQQQQQYPQPQQYPDNPNQQGYYNQQKY